MKKRDHILYIRIREYHIRVFLLWCCLLISLATLLTGCARETPIEQFSSLQSRAFCAEAEGTLNGHPVRVRILSQVSVEKTKEACVEYLSPPLLQGLRVTAQFDTAEDGSLTVTKTELTYADHTRALPPGSTNGILLPLTVLLELNTPDTLQKSETGYTLTYPHDRTLVLSPNGIPTAFSSPHLSLRILEWQFEDVD